MPSFSSLTDRLADWWRRIAWGEPTRSTSRAREDGTTPSDLDAGGTEGTLAREVLARAREAASEVTRPLTLGELLARAEESAPGSTLPS